MVDGEVVAAGRVANVTPPQASTAAHVVAPPAAGLQPTPSIGQPSTAVDPHALAPPVGLALVRMSPAPSPATHSVAAGQVTASSGLGSPPGESIVATELH